MRIAPAHIRTPGPFSAVRPGELPQPVQEPAESSGPEPIDEMLPTTAPPSAPAGRGPSVPVESMAKQAGQAAGAALAAFPQVVHVLANPEFHLGQQIAEETGLPLVSLSHTSVEALEDLLAQPEFSDGFILEGFPVDRASAQGIDALLGATNPNERRVLGWESSPGTQQEIVDHYVDQGLMWMVPCPSASSAPALVKSSLMECLVGLPALN